MGKIIMVYETRLSYAQQLWTPGQYNGTGPYAWNCHFLLDPENEKHAAKIAEIEELERSEFKAAYLASKGSSEKNFETVWKDLAWDDKALRDGVHKAASDGYDGMKFLAARATQGKHKKPIVLTRGKVAVDEGGDGAPYGGAIVNAQVEIWGQYGKYKGSRCTLMGVQMVRDADAFGGGRAADLSQFEPLEDTGEDPDVPAGLV